MNLPWKSNTEIAIRNRPHVGLFRPEFEEVINRFFGPSWTGNGMDWTPSMDLKEDEKEICVSCDIPGVDPKAVDISISGQTLTIKGEKKTEKVENKANYYFAERAYGSFLRTIELPQPVDIEHVLAEQKDGVLNIRMKKLPGAVTKKIPIASHA